jgi:hypothetical protein
MKPWAIALSIGIGIAAASSPAVAQYGRYFRAPRNVNGRYGSRAPYGTFATGTPTYSYAAYTYTGSYRASAANLRRRTSLIRRTDSLARRATTMNRQRRLTRAHLAVALTRLQQIRNDLIASGGNPVQLRADSRLLTRASHALTSWSHGDASFWR